MSLNSKELKNSFLGNEKCKFCALNFSFNCLKDDIFINASGFVFDKSATESAAFSFSSSLISSLLILPFISFLLSSAFFFVSAALISFLNKVLGSKCLSPYLEYNP